MRITNKMMSNNSMMNINGNKEYLDKLNTKMATEKKITRPSDDPIVAIRALRLRSNLSEVSQYYGANVPDAQAWVDVTQRSIDSSMEMISSMRALCNQGANGTNTVSEREKIYQDLEALKSQIYANGNTTYAGRTVFTGFRTEKKLTFTEDTEEDYRGIADRFNASDVVKNTYIEGEMSVADISSLGKKVGTCTADLTTDPANPTITIDGGTPQTLTKKADGSYEPVTENGRTYTVAADGTISVTGADKTTYIVSTDGTVSEITNETGIKEDRVNRIRLSYDNINGTVMTGPTEGWNGAQIGGLTGWTDNYSYFFNEEGMLTDAGEGYHPELPIDGGLMIFSFNEPYDSTFNTRSTLPGAEDYTRKSIISSGNPAEVKKTGNEIEITYPYFGSDMTTKLGDLACTITEYEPGKYSADNNASVKDNGDGTLTVTIPGPNGTKDVYTEITVKADGTAVDSAYKYQKIGEANYWFENGVFELTGKVFANFAKDYTTLVYREELSQKASVPQSSVKTDPYDGLQSYVLDCGTQKYTIKKMQDEDRWFAYDSSDVPQKNIEVTQNTDRSFKIVVSGVEINRDSDEYECDVYNVSANAKAVTSSYHQTPLEVQITDSTAVVASDSGGSGLTAYQYLALDDNDKNSDAAAAKRIFLLADTGELVFGSDIADKLSSLKDIEGVDTISVKYDKSRFNSGDLRPEHYFECKELSDGDTIVDPTTYDIFNQDIYYTVGTNQNIQINTHADEVFDTQIVRELDDILDAINDYNAAEEKVNRLKAMQQDTTAYDETAQAKISVMLDAANKELDIAGNRLQKRYETGIGAFKAFYEQANEANTGCGTRDSRLTLISNRLMEQKNTVKTLASNNEDADITELAIDVKEAELVYNAALMSTGKINQRSLMDYI